MLARVRQRQGKTPAALELEQRARIILQHTGQHRLANLREREESSVEQESSGRSQRAGLKSDERNGSSE